MVARHSTSAGRRGDWLEARSISGGAPRRGQITQVIGRGGHRRYRVRWDEVHESIVYPADGVTVIPRARREPAT